MKIRGDIEKFTKTVSELVAQAKELKEMQSALDVKINNFNVKVNEFANVSRDMASNIKAVIRRQMGD